MRCGFKTLVLSFSLLASLGGSFSEASVSSVSRSSGNQSHAYWETPSPTAEIGSLVSTQSERFLESQGSRLSFYAEPKWKPLWENGMHQIEGDISARLQVFVRESKDEPDAQIRSFHLRYSGNDFRVKAGFQMIPWGETFGPPILDLVNPRDLSDPLLFDPSWVRLPVAAIESQVYLGNTTLQFVFTPLPRTLQGPDPTLANPQAFGIPQNTSFGSITFLTTPTQKPNRIFQDSEYGLRISHLFKSGWDLGLLYFRHWNRNLVYESDFQKAQFEPTFSRVHTLGFTLSKAFDSWVIRSDQAFHINQPLPGIQTVRLGTDLLATPATQIGNQWQGAIGADYSSESDLSLGFQVQGRADFHPASNTSPLGFIRPEKTEQLALSARISKTFFKGKLEPELFLMAGVLTEEYWVQPQIKWNLNDQTSALIRADWIVNPNSDLLSGNLGLLRAQSRLLTWLKFQI